MAKKKEVEVIVVISKIQDGAETYRRGQVLMVDEEWAKARGTSVKIVGATTQITLPTVPPVIVEEAPEVVIEGTPINITEDTDNVQGEGQGREEAKKVVFPMKKKR